jgi:hypothetical protein
MRDYQQYCVGEMPQQKKQQRISIPVAGKPTIMITSLSLAVVPITSNGAAFSPSGKRCGIGLFTTRLADDGNGRGCPVLPESPTTVLAGDTAIWISYCDDVAVAAAVVVAVPVAVGASIFTNELCRCYYWYCRGSYKVKLATIVYTSLATSLVWKVGCCVVAPVAIRGVQLLQSPYLPTSTTLQRRTGMYTFEMTSVCDCTVLCRWLMTIMTWIKIKLTRFPNHFLYHILF